MKVMGLLSWYDERVAQLAACISSLSKLCDRVIAVDGPYALFPGSLRYPRSSPDQAEVILATCEAMGMGCTLHVPAGPWWGNELEKRNFVLRLAELQTEAGDWLLIIDADEVISSIEPGTRSRLEESKYHVAEVSMTERPDDAVGLRVSASPHNQWPTRRLFRVLPNMRHEGAHSIIRADREGQRITLSGLTEQAESSEPLWDLVLEHRNRQRLLERNERAQAYYRMRDEQGIERMGALSG